ncbi:MAG: dienelactone hydrolase family protein [Pseudomonadales bacterium]|nr:dienelactone hydrolase family protein [Pseudomonadales bacterium]
MQNNHLQIIHQKPKRRKKALTILLAHGAGAPMDSDFMNAVADGLFARGFEVCRFEFPYMQERRESGKKRPPDRAPKLLECFREQVTAFGGADNCVVAGKSMGGRMASMLAAELSVKGVICLGYPFHAPGKPDKLRIDHFEAIQSPTLIIQGERDPFGKKDEVAAYPVPSGIDIAWLQDGDHDFKPRKKSGYSHEGNIATAVELMVSFLSELPC